VEQDKEGDGFERLRWGETKESDAVGGAHLTINFGAEFRFSRTFDEIRPSAMLNHREFAGKTERPRRGRRWIIKSAEEPEFPIGISHRSCFSLADVTLTDFPASTVAITPSRLTLE
jgi:hypothetical protein